LWQIPSEHRVWVELDTEIQKWGMAEVLGCIQQQAMAGKSERGNRPGVFLLVHEKLEITRQEGSDPSFFLEKC